MALDRNGRVFKNNVRQRLATLAVVDRPFHSTPLLARSMSEMGMLRQLRDEARQRIFWICEGKADDRGLLTFYAP